MYPENKEGFSMKCSSEEFVKRQIDSEKAAAQRKKDEYIRETLNDSFFQCHFRNCRGLGSFKLVDFRYHLRERHGFSPDQITLKISDERRRRLEEKGQAIFDKIDEEFRQRRIAHNADRGVRID
jgi:hypothetical protein